MPPHFLKGSSALVIRCFKKVETFADWATGAAGPVFVALCWILIVGGGLVFFDTIGRDLSWFVTVVLSPILVLVPLNLYGQYYLVTHVPPGFPCPRASGPSKQETRWLVPNPRSLWSADRWGYNRRGKALSGGLGGAVRGEVAGQTKRVRRCRKCDGPKPERAHHCSVCKRCVLLMDHHCPWINGCVGLHNQRHFVLFMAWLSVACWTISLLGVPRFWDSLNTRGPWPSYTFRIAYTLIYVLCVAIGLAVPVLASWHLWMVAHGETSIESHDNAYLSSKAKAEGLIYLNPYDLGKRRNLELFFHIGPQGYPWTTLLFPLTVPPYTNGWTYPRRSLPSHNSNMAESKGINLHAPELAEGLMSRSAAGAGAAENGFADATSDGQGGRYVMDAGGEDLTDDEEGGGGWMEVSADDAL